MNLNLSFSQQTCTKRPKEQEDVLNFHSSKGIKGPNITESCFRDIKMAINKDKPKAKEYLQDLRAFPKGSDEYKKALKGFANRYQPTAMWLSRKLGFIKNSTPLERIQEANLFIMESLNHPKMDFNKSFEEINKFVCEKMFFIVKRELLKATHTVNYSYNFWEKRDNLSLKRKNQWDGTAESLKIDYSAAAEEMGIPECPDYASKTKEKLSMDTLRTYDPTLTKSMNDPIDGTDDLIIEDKLSSKTEEFDADEMAKKEQLAFVKNHMGELTPLEQDYIKRRVLKAKPDSLKAIAKDHDVTPAGVSAAKNTAAKKLKKILKSIEQKNKSTTH